jgi:hypothetical protein
MPGCQARRLDYIRAEPVKRAEDEFNLGEADCTANTSTFESIYLTLSIFSLLP